MSSMYEKLKEQARESKKRWDRIETIINNLKQKNGQDSEIAECLELLMLNLRPAADIETELKSLEASLFSLENVFGKK